MTEPDQIDHSLSYESPVMRPTARTYFKHLAFLAITFCTATIAGSMFPFGPYQNLPDGDPQTAAEVMNFLFSLPMIYIAMIADVVRTMAADPSVLQYGLTFSTSLLFILISHEMGHYIACRLYRVEATLPFFIPTPPMIGPAGTFGAFIKILSPMPSRRAVFDIGIAGPVAGFIALLPIAIIGIVLMEPATAQQLVNPTGIAFSDPLFVRFVGYLMGKDPAISIGNAFYFAAWIGFLVTALNLIPSGQLDGGHAIYALFGETVHRWTGRIAFVVMATLSVLGIIFFNSPSGFLIAIILAVMMRVKHPEPLDQSPLDAKRKVLALLTLLIFVLCFVPFPIQIN